MRIILFSGTAWRHIYFANEVLRSHDVVLNVRMKRTNNLVDEIKSRFSDADEKLLQAHNEARNQKEQEYFSPSGERFLDAGKVIEVTPEELNGSEVVAAIRAAQADVALVYGTSLLRKPVLDSLQGTLTINLHAGLSPWYKGSTTLFWPVYFMEPQYAGCTFHVIDEKIDHGHIIHQNRPEIKAADGLHDIGCRAIVKAAEDVRKLLEIIRGGKLKDPIQQKKSGKVFYSWDFKPHHLRVTNKLIGDGFLREYVSNRDRFPDPFLIAQF